MSTHSPPHRRGWALILVPAAMAATLAHVLSLWFVCDDAYITFRYAKNLAAGLGPVYNAGERVEGYTNFLWMLLSAAVLGLGAQPEVWMPVLSTICALVTVLVVMMLPPRRSDSPGPAGAIAGILLAGSASFAAWGTSGLETALFGMLITLGYLLLARGGGVGAGLAMGLASLTRPEGILFGATACAYVWIRAVRSGRPRRTAVTATLLWAGLVAAHLAFRLAYYGHWLPNTFAVKTPGTDAMAVGTGYLLGAAHWLHLYFLLIPITAVAWIPRRRGTREDASHWGLLASMLVPYFVYLATTRGDFMPLYRFVAPVLPLLAVAAGASLAALGKSAGRFRALATAGIGVWLAGYAVLNLAESRYEQESWARGDLESVGLTRENAARWGQCGRTIAQLSLPTDTLATTAAGIIPYSSGLYTIDLLGLTAPNLSDYRPRTTRRAGHSVYLKEERLAGLRPQFLLGHPETRTEPRWLGLTLDVSPEWRDRILSSYELLGLNVGGDPVRYVAVAVRADIAERVDDAGDRIRAGGR